MLQRLGFHSWRDLRAWLALALLLSVVFGAALFPGIDRSTSVQHSRAIARQAEADYLTLALTNPSARRRFEFYVVLDALAPGSSVAVGSGLSDDRRRLAEFLWGMGGVERVSFTDTLTTSSLDGIDLNPFVVAQGDGGAGSTPWVIALAEGDDGWAGLRPPGAFLAWLREVGDFHPQPHAAPREFVAIWGLLPGEPTIPGSVGLLLIDRDILNPTVGVAS